MSDTAWLKQVLADAKAATQEWPDWAKDPSVQIELSSVDEISEPPQPISDPNSTASNGNEDLKLI